MIRKSLKVMLFATLILVGIKFAYAANEIILNPKNVTIGVGEKIQLTVDRTNVPANSACASPTPYTSSDESIAVVGTGITMYNGEKLNGGTVLGLKPGKVTITVKDCGFTDTTTVTVVDSSFNPKTGSIVSGIAILVGFIALAISVYNIEKIFR